MIEHNLKLTDYEAANLKALLDATTVGGINMDNGDWHGQIRYKLDKLPTTRSPNESAEMMVERAIRYSPKMNTGPKQAAMSDDPVCAIHGKPLSLGEHEEIMPWCEAASSEPYDDDDPGPESERS